MIRRVGIFLGLLAASAALGCGGTLRETAGGTADFDRAKAEFENGQTFDAIADFKAYIELYPGTEKTDDALYYLGEAYLRQKDYALASGQFDRLIRDFPSSPFHADALFQLARCDDLQSHGAPLDQAETERALARYNQFLDRYPDHARSPEAMGRIQALRDRLAEKQLRTGRLYAKLRQYPAAELTLRGLLRDYSDSKWAAEAALLLADVLLRAGKRDEAVETLKRIQASAPEGTVRQQAGDRLRELEPAGSPR